MARPGPGQVIELAKQVNSRRSTTPYANGVRTALRWALGDESKHPLKEEVTKKYPPDMGAITKVAREAKVVGKKHPLLNGDYCRGVWECLSWIYGYRARPPRP